jgi:hypothetical protein
VHGNGCNASPLCRFITPHLCPSLPDALALRWAPGGTPHSWRRAFQPAGPQGPAEEADGLALWPVGGAAADSHIAPGALVAYWMASSTRKGAMTRALAHQQGLAGARERLELPEAYREYAAAARAPGALEAMLACKAEALAALEARMASVAGGSKSDEGGEAPHAGACPVMQAARAGAAAPGEAAAGDAAVSTLREAAAEPWGVLASGGSDGLARAALDALRLDRAGAVADAAADAARPLRERVGGVRALLLRMVPGTGEVAGKFLYQGEVVEGPPGEEAAAPAADGALPFAEGDWLRVTGLHAAEAGDAWGRGVAAALAGRLGRRGANCRVAAVGRAEGTGRPVFYLSGMYTYYKGGGEDAETQKTRAYFYHQRPLNTPDAFAFEYAVLEPGGGDYLGNAADRALCSIAADGGGDGGAQAGAGRAAAERANAWLSLLAAPRGSGAGGTAAAKGSKAPAARASAVALSERAAALLAAATWPLPGGGTGRLHADQIQAVAAGLPARVQLIQGPPGTGKTEALAAAIAAALLLEPGCARVGISSHTHSAIDNALARYIERRGAYLAARAAAGPAPEGGPAPGTAAPPGSGAGAAGGGANAVQCFRAVGRDRWAACPLAALEPAVMQLEASRLLAR